MPSQAPFARSFRAAAAVTALVFVAVPMTGVAAKPAAASASALTELPFDRILRYEDLTRLLQQWAAARPSLVRLESIGRTPEGRELWFLTITNTATGPAADKPALL